MRNCIPRTSSCCECRADIWGRKIPTIIVLWSSFRRLPRASHLCKNKLATSARKMMCDCSVWRGIQIKVNLCLPRPTKPMFTPSGGCCHCDQRMCCLFWLKCVCEKVAYAHYTLMWQVEKRYRCIICKRRLSVGTFLMCKLKGWHLYRRSGRRCSCKVRAMKRTGWVWVKCLVRYDTIKCRKMARLLLGNMALCLMLVMYEHHRIELWAFWKSSFNFQLD